MSRGIKVLTKKVNSRISLDDYNKLRVLAKQGGFKSVYELIKSLINCYLKTATDVRVNPESSISIEIESMFEEFTDNQAMIYSNNSKKKRRRTVNDE